MDQETEQTNNILIYEAEDGHSSVEVTLEKGTLWLNLRQISELFSRHKSVISRHLRNTFKEGGLEKEATVAKTKTVQKEAGREVVRQINYFNLDAILSVGYRVNCKQGTRFRIWATNILRYPNIPSRAAHLLYFVIKNHPFSDGNKRIASFLFLLYLQRNQQHLDKSVSALITDNTLVALALLVAGSDPAQKELMIHLIQHLLAEGK